MKNLRNIFYSSAWACFVPVPDYLDIVPDNVTTWTLYLTTRIQPSVAGKLLSFRPRSWFR